MRDQESSLHPKGTEDSGTKLVTLPGHRASSVLVISRCSSTFGQSQGGADVLARRHAMALARSGQSVCLVSGVELNLPRSGIVSLVRPTHPLLSRLQSPRTPYLVVLLNESLNVLRATARAFRILTERSFDLVLSNHSLTTLLVKLGRPKQSLIHYVHDGLHAHRYANNLAVKMVRYFLNDLLEVVAATVADRVFCVSAAIKSQLGELGIAPSKMDLVAPMVEVCLTSRLTPEELSSVSPPVPFPRYILSVGQQSGRKRFDVLIRAMKRLPPNVGLVLVGDGPLHASYRELARLEELTERVLFLRGVGDGELGELYSRAALFALVSESEGFPVTVAEAISFGGRVLLACPTASAWNPSDQKQFTVIPRIPTSDELGGCLATLLTGPDLSPSEEIELHGNVPGVSIDENTVLAIYSRVLAVAPE